MGFLMAFPSIIHPWRLHYLIAFPVLGFSLFGLSFLKISGSCSSSHFLYCLEIPTSHHLFLCWRLVCWWSSQLCPKVASSLTLPGGAPSCWSLLFSPVLIPHKGLHAVSNFPYILNVCRSSHRLNLSTSYPVECPFIYKTPPASLVLLVGCLSFWVPRWQRSLYSSFLFPLFLSLEFISPTPEI